jgi:hypothetical protein
MARAAVTIAVVAAPIVAVTPAASAAPGVVGTRSVTGPAQRITVRSLPAPAPSTAALPFRPLAGAGFASAKARANSGAQRATPRVASPLAPSVLGPLTGSGPARLLSTISGMTKSTESSGFGITVEPPDPQLATGPSNVVEMVNSVGSVFTKSGTNVENFSLEDFFVPNPGTRSTYPVFSDPRILYDAPSGRWFASGVELNPTTNDSQVTVAVSSTSDPTQPWTSYTVKANTSGTIYDQPKIGVCDNTLTVSWNDFTSGSVPAGSETWVLSKSELVSAAPTVGEAGFSDPVKVGIVPVQSLSSTSTQYAVYNDGASTAGVITFTGTPPGTVTENVVDLSLTQALSVPPNAAQKGSANLVTTNDQRYLTAVWQNSTLWVSGNDGCTPAGDSTQRSCARLDEISTSGSMSLTQDFDVGTSGAYVYFPAVSLDSSGDMFMVATGSSTTTYPSVVTDTQSTGATAGTVVAGPGVGTSLGPYNASRWGDYSGAATDPSSTDHVWVVGENVASSTDSTDWGTVIGQLTLTPAPTVTSVSPGSGTTSGATAVTVTGTNLSGATAVDFGTSAATIGSCTATSCSVTSPPHAAGTVDVTVTTSGGTSATSAADQFTYTATPPTVTGVSPNTGYTTGSTSVTVTGTNLFAATAVDFGTSAATVTSCSPTSCSVTSPAHAAGTVDVTVTTAGGTSATSSADQFTYSLPPPPTVTAVSPKSGFTTGGTAVTVTGTNLFGATAVDFGTSPATIGSCSATSCSVTSPAHAAGTVDVTVTTPGGTSATGSADQFSYAKPPPGYWLVASDGGIFTFGVPYLGSTGGMSLNQPIVGMAADPATGGYWLVAADGGIFTFDAPYLGSTGAMHLNRPIVGMAATPDGGGYWLVASDGGIFTFGDAPFYGSTGAIALNRPIVGMAADPATGGYWLVASDGGIFTFNAPFFGSTGAIALNRPIVGMAADPATGGYWLVASDGGIFTFNTPYLGSTGGIPLNRPIVGMSVGY